MRNAKFQALERTQPVLPMGFLYIDGAIVAQCKPRHRHYELLTFLRHIEANVPA